VKGLALSPEQEYRRAEPGPDEKHYHVWRDRGLVLIAQPPRFRTSQAAGAAAARRWKRGSFMVRRCGSPCRFTVKRKRKRRPRKPCRHCGKA